MPAPDAQSKTDRLYVQAPPEDQRLMRELRIVLEREQDKTLTVSDVYRYALGYLAEQKNITVPG